MSRWSPITDAEFADLLREQTAELSGEELAAYARFRVEPWKATIKRSDTAPDELVFVVAQHGPGVLYFDDVEYGFNISEIDSSGRILTPGGSQNSLQGAVRQWLLPDAS